MKLDFSANFKTPDGKDTDGNIGKTLGSALLSGVEKDKHRILKYYTWAEQLYNTGILSVDNADVKLLSEFVVNSDGFTVLAKATILNIIDGAKE